MSQNIVLIDGFDHYQASKSQAAGWDVAFTSMTTGRNGVGYAARTVGNAARKAFPAAYGTAILGVAFRCSTYTVGAGDDALKLFAGATLAVRLRINSNRTITIRNNAGTVIATSASAISYNTWYFLELKAVKGASGTAELRLDGVTWIAATTGDLGTTDFDAFGYHGSGGSTELILDDLRIGDGTSGSLPDFLGDTTVETVFPTSDGANADFTPSTGANHYALVDESSGTYPNDDTDYNSSSTAGHRDTFGMSDLAYAGSILALQVEASAREDGVGARSIASVVRVGSTNYDGTTQDIITTYKHYRQIYSQLPDGSALNKANVDAAEFGVKIVA